MLRTEKFTKVLSEILTPILQPMLSNIVCRMETVEKELCTTKADLVRTQKKVSEQSKKISCLEKDIMNCKNGLKLLQDQTRSQERSVKMNNLRITGIEGNVTEIKTSFVHLAGEKLKVNVKPEDITVTGIPVSNRNTLETRSLISFNNIWTRNLCYDRRSRLKGTNVYISEDLTKKDSQIFYRTNN